jgi:hypothetical protein
MSLTIPMERLSGDARRVVLKAKWLRREALRLFATTLKRESCGFFKSRSKIRLAVQAATVSRGLIPLYPADPNGR